MDHTLPSMQTPPAAARVAAADGYQAPTYEVLCLACEISSYAPDEGDSPLF